MLTLNHLSSSYTKFLRSLLTSSYYSLQISLATLELLVQYSRVGRVSLIALYWRQQMNQYILNGECINEYGLWGVVY